MSKAYVATYHRDPASDWPFDYGDDPSFQHALRTGGRLTWGVCRPNVRNLLAKGDVVIFFAADRGQHRRPIRYNWIGFATVDEQVPQTDVFLRPRHTALQAYPNLLVKPDPTIAGAFVHHEPALPRKDWHDDWLWRMLNSKRRKKEAFDAVHASDRYDPRTTRVAGSLVTIAPNYIIFAPVQDGTWVATEPPLIAEAEGPGSCEIWQDEPLAVELRNLLFSSASRSTLRTTNMQRAHPPLVLGNQVDELKNRLRTLASKYNL